MIRFFLMNFDTMNLTLGFSFVLCFLTACHYTVSEDDCLPVVGSEITITRSVDKDRVGADGKLKWKFIEHDGDTNTIATCSVDNKCSYFHGNGYSSTVVESGDKYYMTLTVTSINKRRDQATWSWYANDQQIGKCKMSAYYWPTMTSFTANSESQKLIVAADETVEFVCVYDGIPTPTVYVIGQRSRQTITLNDVGQRSNGSKMMSCRDTDKYTCMADNVFGQGVAKSVSVFVECMPELLLQSDKFIKEYPGSTDSGMTVKVSIVGYPDPHRYTLISVVERKEEETEVSFVDGSFYSVTYEPGQPPEGKVVLTMFNMETADTGQYVLAIDNGIGKGLDYIFKVKVKVKVTVDVDSDEYDSIWIIVVLVGGMCIIGLCVGRYIEVYENDDNSPGSNPVVSFRRDENDDNSPGSNHAVSFRRDENDDNSPGSNPVVSFRREEEYDYGPGPI